MRIVFSELNVQDTADIVNYCLLPMSTQLTCQHITITFVKPQTSKPLKSHLKQTKQNITI